MAIATAVSTLIKVLHSHPVCDACLGRMYRACFQGMANSEIGASVRKYAGISDETPVADCWVCEGLTGEIDYFVSLVEKKLMEYEFTNFLIGTQIADDVIARQRQIAISLDIENDELLKMALNREIGKQLEEHLQKPVDFTHPDITVIINTAYDVVHLQLKSLYIYGRYRKYQRGIPQTRWPCRVCRGKGCQRCDNTGKMYPTSVEELIALPIEQLVMGKGIAFHGCGREDIDARMLGTGRPFVVEIKNPQIRTLDFASLTKHINEKAEKNVEVEGLRYSNKDEIVRIKDADFRKTYRIVIEGSSRLAKEKLNEGALILRGTTIRQFTPTRVAHRRAHKVRERTVYQCSVETVEGTMATLVLETESGTYIKELVSGDHGRTQPNLSDLIGIPCIVKELDVIEIKGE